MSTTYYQQKWEEAIYDLLDCVREQKMPLDQNKNDKGLTYKRTDLEWFQYYGQLYVRYLQVYRKLEDSYDQTVHPQKRIIMKQMLQNVIVRMCEVKQNLIFYSTQTNTIQSDFINVDEILNEMKLTPKALNVPIPKYCNDKNTKRDKILESVMDQFRKKNFASDIKEIPQEIEVFNDNITLEASFETLIRIIQKIERGRQGIVRGLQIMRLRNKPNKERANEVQNENENEIIVIQKFWRAFSARRELAMMRAEQLKFLGIQKEPVDKTIFQVADSNRKELKTHQQALQKQFQNKKYDIKREIETSQSKIIKAKMQDQRRKWINKFLQIHEFSNLPNNLKEFYQDKENMNKPNVQEPKPKEQKKKEPKKQAKDEGKAKAVKKNQVQKFLDQHISQGPTEAVINIQKTVQSYQSTWASRDCSETNEEGYDRELAKNQIRPQIQAQLEKEVDILIGLQLDSMRIKYGIKKRKEKKPKKKKKKEKKVKIPQGLGKRDPSQLLQELFQCNVAKVLNKANMSDFIGEHNNLNYLLEKNAETQPDPSMAQVKNLVAEYVGIPLGSEEAKNKLEKWNWFLFYGPMGTGKTLLTRALQNQTNSVLFDLSPNNIKDQLNEKSQLTKLIWSVIICAKQFQPAIVLVEDFQTIFPGAAGKGKKKTADPNNNFGPKLKKPLLDLKKNKLWTKNDRVAVIGCSNKPYDASMKQMKKLFDKKIYFPYPNYATRKLMLQTFIQNKVGPLNNFPYNTLAHTTQGFTAGSYIKSIQKVLTEMRMSRLKDQPLKMSQLIVPLSNTPCVFADQYEKFKKFNDEVTGLKQRREAKNSKKQDEKKDKKDKKDVKKK